MNRDYAPLLRMTSIFKGREIESMNIIDIGMETMKYAQMTQLCADDFEITREPTHVNGDMLEL